MPLGIGGLTSLQTLSKVIIEGDDGFNISDLKGLVNLQSPLSIKGLDKVINPIQAKDASLNQKKGLCDLEMEWANHVSEDFGMPCNRVLDVSFNETTEYEVLQGLKPHNKLRNLKILFYGGKQFPRWVGDPSFDQLRELTLRGCISCEQLPALGHLQSLQMLSVESLNAVVNLDSMFLAHTNSVHHVAFPSLTVLKFKHMPRWERWSTSVGGDNATSGLFPRLGEIYIGFCPKLAEVSIGFIPSLRDVTIQFCGILKSYSCPNSVENLCIGYCGSLTSLTFSTVHEIPSSLKTLGIDGCYNLRSFGEGYFIYLTDLCISGCDNIETIEQGVKSFGCLLPPSITWLEVSKFEDLESLSDVLPHLTCLRTLLIEKCPKLKDLPETTISL
ncbi:Disease resistance protein [Artemisia annua]|uniref:Disease resistance protein n=1 Tax=Artemisia annua TaxID=35608 RepID=A0A2U1KG19_ARTAN|nr:Disease resistance protein [Artemisia annua]